jgi:2-dehydro-3-deoxy-D-arabinonate dehydratase
VHIVRYRASEHSRPLVGVRDSAGVRRLDVPSLGALLSQPIDSIRAVLSLGAPVSVSGMMTMLPPADGRMEVWAAGVT